VIGEFTVNGARIAPRTDLGHAAAGSEDVVLLGLLGVDDEYWQLGANSKDLLNGGRPRDRDLG
jgi:hypothetical protein